MTFADAFRPRWQHSDPAVRTQEVSSISDRGTLEAIVESNAPTDVRQIAADRLFGDPHVLSHARRSIREAAATVLGDPVILRTMAENDSDPAVRALALDRLGDNHAVRTCGICGHKTLHSVAYCKCGFDLAKGDLAAAKSVCEAGRRRGTKELITGALLIVIGLAGGVTFFPIHFDFYLQLETHRIDLLFVLPGFALMIGGWMRRTQPWRALTK
jgi:hypothetical protein